MSNQASIAIRTAANWIAEKAAQSAYAAGGVDEWNVELDGDNPCPMCEDAAANGPYRTDEGPELPIHDRCECESSPIDNSSGSSDSRSLIIDIDLDMARLRLHPRSPL